jgi:hypothetical protein
MGCGVTWVSCGHFILKFNEGGQRLGVRGEGRQLWQQ